jgi:hypothetical protein
VELGTLLFGGVSSGIAWRRPRSVSGHSLRSAFPCSLVHRAVSLEVPFTSPARPTALLVALCHGQVV